VAQKSSSTGCPWRDSRRTTLPERSLSSKLGAAATSPRLWLEQAVNNATVSASDSGVIPRRWEGLADEQGIQALLDFRLGVDADQLIYDFPAFEEEQARDRRDPVASGDLRIVIGV